MRTTSLRLRPVAFVAAFALALAADASFGASGSLTLVRDFTNYSGIYNGGEIGVSQFDGTVAGMANGVVYSGNRFQTFCLERNETLAGSGTWTLSTSAKSGGNAGQTSPGEDPLSPETAYLYDAFCRGQLTGYDYAFGQGRRDSADELQWAVWMLEEEVYPNQLDPAVFPRAFAWVEEAFSATYTGAWSGLGGVGVLNVTDASGAFRQDVLVLTEVAPPPAGGGGHTPGFWRNKNGQALIGSDDLAALTALHLCDGSGNAYDPSSKSNFGTWLKNGKAVNMSYMLSIHLAAMRLNVLNGFVAGGALVYAPGCGNTGPGNDRISIVDLMSAADAALAADSYTPSGDANRSYQESLKNALDAANNDQNWVP